MQAVPTPEEQNWLLERLAELIEARGEDSFLRNPIVQPTPEFFPDKWEFSHFGLDRVVRRLLQYAGLTDIDPIVESYVEAGPTFGTTLGSSRNHHQGTAGLFMGSRDGRYLFAFNEDALSDAEYMAGVMAHEVAHAYRAHHGLVVDDTDEEELLTDLTTIYLGTGILTANVSFTQRTERDLTSWTRTERRAGYLTPQGFVFALAAQLVARDLDQKDQRRLLKHLERDQRSMADIAAAELWERQETVIRSLRLERAGDGTERPLTDILLPLPDYGAPAVTVLSRPGPDARGEGDRHRLVDNEGQPVFRTPSSHASMYTVLGTLLGLGLLMLLSALGHPFAGWPGVIALIAGGALFGARRRYDKCSDPECSMLLPPGAVLCPRCRGSIIGTAATSTERMEAAEAWRRARRASRRTGEHPADGA